MKYNTKFAAIALTMMLATPALGQSATSNSPTTAPPLPTPAAQAARAKIIAERLEEASRVMRKMLPPNNIASMENPQPGAKFGGEFARLAYENAYAPLWSRPGLTLKERSLVTIGILIGAGAEDELQAHFEAGLRNGLTPAQLEEVVYQATAYAGFPRASRALALASKAVAAHQP